MNTVIKILAIFLLISIGVNIWQWINPRTIKAKAEIVYLPGEEKKVIIYSLPDGNQSATVQNSKEYEKATKEARELLETVKSIPDLENEKKITSLISANMKLELGMSEKDMAINDKEKELKQWKDKFNTINLNNNSNEITVSSEVSPKIATTEKREKFYLPKQNYTVITSENPAVKFYGLESYTFKNPKQKDFVELNLKLQGLYFNESLIPYGGVELLFNPDGKFKPIFGYGYFYNNSVQIFEPYFMGGIQYNLIRF